MIRNALNKTMELGFVFENEAQFRDAFVCHLREEYSSNYEIAIEVHFKQFANGRYGCFDVVMQERDTKKIIPIELKYHKGKPLAENLIGKAVPSNNYYKRKAGFESDKERIKAYIKEEENADKGYAVFLLYGCDKELLPGQVGAGLYRCLIEEIDKKNDG